jgi:acetyl esterase/lipase
MMIRHKYIFALLAIVASVLLYSPSGVAQQAHNAGGKLVAKFNELDRDHDGFLTPEELGRPKLFKILDADKDGKLSLDEVRNAPADAEGKREEKLYAPTFADVKYGPYECNVFDFWQAPSDKPTPLIVFIHGGGFVGGDKSQVQSAAIETARESGVSVMSINYRFLPQAPLQDILRDCARAIQYVRLNADKFNIDPKRIASFGGSAGAGTSLWLAVHDDLADSKAEDPVLRQSTRISAAACVNGQATYDFGQWEKIVYPFKPEWKSSPTEILKFYHFKSQEEFDSEAGRKIRADYSMVDLLTKDDPPIWMYCSQPEGEPTSRNHLVHHPKHVHIIKQKGDEVGVKVETCFGTSGDPWQLATEFLMKQLGVTVSK